MAPLSGKIVILVPWLLGISLACLRSGFGKNGIKYASISTIWFVSSDVYVLVVWLNVMWVMSVSMVTSLVSRLYMTAQASHNCCMFGPMLCILPRRSLFPGHCAGGCCNLHKPGGLVRHHFHHS